MTELASLVTAWLQDLTGCAAAGIRLPFDDDFPYFETRGFSSGFVEDEKWLCVRDPLGFPLRQADGDLQLECMCGTVIQGRAVPSLPFFTDFGSFHTGSTSTLLAHTGSAELQGPTRNRCAKAGYESVLLVPLRHGGRQLGLLQLNDPRPDLFPPAQVKLLERAAGHIAIAAAQMLDREQIEKERALADSYLDVAGVLILALDRDGRVTLINRRGCEVLGLPRDRILGRDWFDSFLPERERTRLRQVFAGLMDDRLEGVERFEDPVLTASGEERLISWRNTVLRDELGRITGTLSSGDDVTERRRLELGLRRAQKLQAIGRLAAGVAHEVNNPLQLAIITTPFLREAFTTLSAVSNPTSEAQREDLAWFADELPEALERLDEALERIAGAVSALGRLAASGPGGPQEADLDQLLRDTMEVTRNATKNLADVEADLGGLPPVLCHQAELAQVFLALLLNAGRAIEERADGAKRGSIRVRSRVQGEQAEIAISDDGCGIPPELQERIFEPSTSAWNTPGGTGQSLAECWAVVVELHSGQLDFDSLEGRGTSFRLRIPLRPPTRQAQHD